MVAGGAAGFCQTVVTTPMELLKIHMQLAQQAPGRKASAMSLARRLVSTQGWKTCTISYNKHRLYYRLFFLYLQGSGACTVVRFQQFCVM